MPSTNVKMEAMRLEQAKLAIKKMKRNRREGNGPRPTSSKVQSAPEGPAPGAHVAHVRDGKSLVSSDHHPRQPSATTYIKPSKKRIKMPSFKRPAKEPAEDDTLQRKRSNLGSPSKDSSLSDSVFETTNGPNLSAKESLSGRHKKRSKASRSCGQSSNTLQPHQDLLFWSPTCDEPSTIAPTPQAKIDMNEDWSALTPLYTRARDRRVYFREGSVGGSSLKRDDVLSTLLGKGKSEKDQVKPGVDGEWIDEVAPNELEVVSSKITVPQRMKMMKRLKVVSSLLGKRGRKVNAPMSIKTSTNVVKKPLFQITTHDITRNALHSQDVRQQLPSLNIPVTRDRSKFKVTSVSNSDKSNDDVTNSENEEEETPENELVDSEHFNVEEEEPREVHNDPSMIQFHFIDGQVILHLKHPSTFVFCGQVQVQVLKGAVEVLGYCLKPSCGLRTIFSPKGSSLLSLQTTVVEDSNFTTPSMDIHCSSLAALVQKGSDYDAFLLLTKTEEKLSLFLEQYITTQLFPRPLGKQEDEPFQKASNRLQCLCYPPKGYNIFEKGDLWDKISKDVIRTKGCTVVCGGKGVGKSTMLRFLVNRYISSGEQGVLLIDLDPGQAELTIPGCISLSVVRQPLLGPNFTHLQDPVKCVYIGDVNVSNCTSRFMDACLTIVNFWQSEEQWKNMPCIVNTMGFNKGLGVTIMVQMISLLQPTSVIQICSKSKARNYPENLTEEYVKKNCSSSPFALQLHTSGRRFSIGDSLNYTLYLVETLAESNVAQTKAWGLDAKISREIVIMSYLSKIIQPPCRSLLEVVPYCCPLDALYLSVCHEPVPPSVTVPAFNASLVALCDVNPEKRMVHASGPGFPSIVTGHFTAHCLGFGIVRGIDMESKQLYLLSPVSPKILSSVNCLVLGAVCIPPSIYLTPPKEPGPIPYVIATESQHAAKPSKRIFRYSRPFAGPST